MINTDINPNLSEYAINIKTVQGTTFKILIEALKEILTDTVLIINESGIRICTMDSSHVILIHMKLEASKFESYYSDGEQMIGLNMLNLNKLIKTINNNDTISFTMLNSDKNKLEIRVENTDKNTLKISKLNLLDLDNTNMEITPVEFNSVINLPSSDFQKICRDMANLSDFVEIKNTDNKLIFSCKGDFCSHDIIMNNSENGISIDQPDISSIYQGEFDSKYLLQFTKCTNLSNTIELYLKNDYPLIVQYAVGSLGTIKLCLAPQQHNET
jgi:proliferating cell nuclear antigen